MNAPVDFKAIEGMFRRHYKQIEVEFEPEHAVAWTYMKPSGAPCFNLGMLEELRAHDSAIESCGGRVLYKDDLHQTHYYVGGSRYPAGVACCTRETCIRFTTTSADPGSKAYSAWAETSRIWCS